jgi:hypothetical protein
MGVATAVRAEIFALPYLVVLPFPGIVSGSDLQTRNLRALVARTG